MKVSNLIKGLTILQPYYKGGDGGSIGAERGQIYANYTDRPLTPGDVLRMRELGWFQPEEENEDGYDPEDGWSAFA